MGNALATSLGMRWPRGLEDPRAISLDFLWQRVGGPSGYELGAALATASDNPLQPRALIWMREGTSGSRIQTS